MRLFYKKTDGGAEYYCLHHIGDGKTGDLTTAVLRTDGDNELELNTYKLAQMGIDVVIKS